MNGRNTNINVIEHDNGFTMANIRVVDLGTEPYVLPSQCEHVFYSEVTIKVDCSCVVRYDPRGRIIELYHVQEYVDIEEEYDAEVE